MGSNPYFIIEADEYDTAFFDKRSKFVHYHPNFLVLNNIEFDHADIFKDLDQILWQFHQLLRMLPSDTKIIANGQDKNINELFHQGVWSERILFGQSEQFNWSANADTHGAIRLLHEQATVAQINPQIIGDHNMMNILAAAATLSLVDIDENQMLESIERFPGVKRRLEFLGEFSGVHIYDDFAHHPTSIKASIHSLKAKFQESSVFTITELACNTMKKGALKEELLDSFDEADFAWIINDKDIKWDIENQFASKKHVSITSNHDALSEELNGKVKPGDIILIMTNRSSVPIREALIDIFDS
jgi:UDP-N-acetylmuramate: L-alanyl-gamma-D-glutamyl-meso-diaminopimelate ligase